MKTTLPLTAALIVAVFGSFASAQSTDHLHANQGHSAYRYHSSTGAEGYLRGTADLLRGAGVYNLYSSQAAINMQEARGAAIDNNYKFAQTYFAMRQLNREARTYEQGPHITKDEAAEIASMQAPDRLDGSQFEPTLRTFNWPVALEGPQYADQRAEISRLFAERSTSDKNEHTIAAVVDQMEEMLKEEIRGMSPSQYLESKNFLAGVGYEAQFRTDIIGIASN